MITKQLETVLKDSLGHKLQLKQKCKQKVGELKKARVCTEWRKARSRVAARNRREKESQLFREIATLLPLAPNIEAQLDKASVIRLTIAYLHLRAILNTPDPCTASATTPPASAGPGEPAEVNKKGFFNDALGRFLLIVSLNGKIIYTTKDVTFHTGINQMDLIGRSLFDFMHPCDQKELKESLTKLIGCQEQQMCELFLRIKSASNNKLTPWKVIHCTGVKKSSSTSGTSCLLLLCRSLPVQDVIQIGAYLNFKTFLSIHGPDMKFTYCHSGVQEMTGFSDTELYGQSVYQYYHPSDCQHIHKAHLCLFAKGQVYTGKYRLLQKHGGYVWVETEATVVYNIRTGKPESVVCVNYILSGVEMADVVFSLEQTDWLMKPCDPLHSKFQPIHPFTTTTQAESTASDKHAESVLRDGAANGQSVIKQNSAKCNSLTCDICQLDLDSLAPYIPMDEEDFLLTPTSDSVAVNSDLKRLPSRPCTSLDLDQRPRLEPVPPTEGVISPALRQTDSTFSLTDGISKGAHAVLVSSRPRHDTQHTVNRNQVEHSSQTPSFHKKTNHWTGMAKVSQHLTKALGKNSDGLQSYSLPGSVPWDPVFSNPPWYLPESHHTTQTRAVKMHPAPTGLPVLSSSKAAARPELTMGSSSRMVVEAVANYSRTIKEKKGMCKAKTMLTVLHPTLSSMSESEPPAPSRSSSCSKSCTTTTK
ncbi:hypoxia-inducible factor 1-alpha-like isoform X1 [Astyanax mexicanus]|uniref:Hypoxia-inducible factor 1-alpha n=1 Tax=Astyanax mexicanus TaxID=7994 RepID=A0A8T2L2A0_ASTMX|nr:hypoxia-inducible factor 1-alpha-like isoform X1 [Astyanax mexicanus]